MIAVIYHDPAKQINLGVFVDRLGLATGIAPAFIDVQVRPDARLKGRRPLVVLEGGLS